MRLNGAVRRADRQQVRTTVANLLASVPFRTVLMLFWVCGGIPAPV